MEGAVERVIRKPASGSEYSRWVLLPFCFGPQQLQAGGPFLVPGAWEVSGWEIDPEKPLQSSSE